MEVYLLRRALASSFLCRVAALGTETFQLDIHRLHLIVGVELILDEVVDNPI